MTSAHRDRRVPMDQRMTHTKDISEMNTACRKEIVHIDISRKVMSINLVIHMTQGSSAHDVSSSRQKGLDGSKHDLYELDLTINTLTRIQLQGEGQSRDRN